MKHCRNGYKVHRHYKFLSSPWKGIHSSWKNQKDSSCTHIRLGEENHCNRRVNDLSTTSLENFISNLMTYEVQLEDRKNDERHFNPRRKYLPSIHPQIWTIQMTMKRRWHYSLSKKFRKFLKQGKFIKKNKDTNDNPICFKWNKPGHIKKDLLA